MVKLLNIRKPKIKPKDLLVKVKAAGICGTDVHIYDWTSWASNASLKVPLVLGHEFSGEIMEVGEKVEGFNVGDRVAGEPRIPCMRCYMCMTGKMHICQNYRIFGLHTDGAFAEYALVPAVCAYKIPSKISCEEGAAFEPLGMAVHAIEEANISPGDVIAILGCGPIGLLAVQVAKASGTMNVVASDVNVYRLKLADKLGADVTLDPRDENYIEEILELTGEKGGVDVVIEASGSPAAIRQGLNILRKDGRMILVGLPSKTVDIDISGRVVFRELTLKGVHGRIIWSTWKRAALLVSSRKVNIRPVLTHIFSLEDFGEGFELAKSGQTGKVIFKI